MGIAPEAAVGSLLSRLEESLDITGLSLEVTRLPVDAPFKDRPKIASASFADRVFSSLEDTGLYELR